MRSLDELVRGVLGGSGRLVVAEAAEPSAKPDHNTTKQEVSGTAQTLVQCIHHKQEVSRALQTLATTNNLCINPIP